MKLISLIKQTAEEVKKITYPTIKETYIGGIMILIAIVIFSVVLMSTDFILSKIIKLILGIG